MLKNHNLKFGLCCLFHNEPIKFKTYTKTALQKLSVLEQIDKILLICSHNIKTLQEAINYCYKNNIDFPQIYSHILLIFLQYFQKKICLGFLIN